MRCGYFNIVMGKLLLLVVVMFLACQTASRGTMSSPYVPKSKGPSVVKEAVEIIEGLNVFPSDHKFLCRVAWVESKYGLAAGTYRDGYHGGIWQVLKVVCNNTNAGGCIPLGLFILHLFRFANNTIHSIAFP